MVIDLSKWLRESQRTFFNRGYLQNDNSPEERYTSIVNQIEKLSLEMSKTDESRLYLKNIKQRFIKYINEGWVSFATPILANFGGTYNLPISCNVLELEDSLDSIYSGVHEIGMLAKYGAGTSQNFSKIRPLGSEIKSGGVSNSVLDWIELYAHTMSKTSQNSTRRGHLAAYLSISHPEIEDFLDIGTDKLHENKQRFFQTITTGVTIPKGWMKDLKEGDSEKRKIWSKLLKVRKEIGYPYIIFLENVDNQKPQVYKDKNMLINSSNICSEIAEYTDEYKTFACCLSSVNLWYYDEWKNDSFFIKDMNIMLDCVIEEYIQKGETLSGLSKSILFAKEHRSVGLGVLGFHSYLQKNQIAIGSLDSFRLNNEIFKKLRTESDEASQWMALHFGEPEIMKGYGYRNSTRLAQAPTKSTAFIMGGDWLNLSEGIEPLKSNYLSVIRAKIQVEVKNPILEEVLEKYGKNNRDTWLSILQNNGSVQHLDFLSDHEKNVFKCFYEISQVDLIKLAAQRQKWIDQSQSLNIMIHPKMSPKDINELHLLAFDEGIKSLYYSYSINAVQEFNRELLMSCSSCEG